MLAAEQISMRLMYQKMLDLIICVFKYNIRVENIAVTEI